MARRHEARQSAVKTQAAQTDRLAELTDALNANNEAAGGTLLNPIEASIRRYLITATEEPPRAVWH